ncbi:sensor histidine kinase [Mucilaginibacter sp.]|uniref:sensor histidine kinase n=1 Tax=Mucilaginibacter sp. TaxID=1882438 RepID=UPI003D0D3FA6
MKLSAHYNKVSISISVVVLCAGALIYYFAIHKIARNQLDTELSEEFAERLDYLNRYNKIPKKDFDENITEFKKVGNINYPTRFFDTVYYDQREKTYENGRAVTGLVKVNNDTYIAIVTESYDSINGLTQLITLITLALMVFLLLILFITNKYVLNGLWKPFYTTLHQLNEFTLSDVKAFYLKDSKVDEFNELNKAVQKMASRVKKDYQHLKHFTENASHEMMTPLAVITSKLDTLIQDETLKADQFEQINDIYSATGKLSRLNQSLLLLVKIENNLIDDAETLNMQILIQQKLRQFQELISTRCITISDILTEKELFVSKTLIDILLNNLFSNAIRHNIDGGKINIQLTSEKLIFQNTGIDLAMDKDTMFERFKKGNKSEGTGLGLTIAENICQLYNWKIDYQHTNSMHIFTIVFN